MKKIRAAIVGYGNIGKYVLEALKLLLILKWQVLYVVIRMTYRTN